MPYYHLAILTYFLILQTIQQHYTYERVKSLKGEAVFAKYQINLMSNQRTVVFLPVDGLDTLLTYKPKSYFLYPSLLPP